MVIAGTYARLSRGVTLTSFQYDFLALSSSVTVSEPICFGSPMMVTFSSAKVAENHILCSRNIYTSKYAKPRLWMVASYRKAFKPTNFQQHLCNGSASFWNTALERICASAKGLRNLTPVNGKGHQLT